MHKECYYADLIKYLLLVATLASNDWSGRPTMKSVSVTGRMFQILRECMVDGTNGNLCQYVAE